MLALMNFQIGASTIHDVSLGGVSTSRQLCIDAARGVPEHGLWYEFLHRELWK